MTWRPTAEGCIVREVSRCGIIIFEGAPSRAAFMEQRFKKTPRNVKSVTSCGAGAFLCTGFLCTGVHQEATIVTKTILGIPALGLVAKRW